MNHLIYILGMTFLYVYDVCVCDSCARHQSHVRCQKIALGVDTCFSLVRARTCCKHQAVGLIVSGDSPVSASILLEGPWITGCLACRCCDLDSGPHCYRASCYKQSHLPSLRNGWFACLLIAKCMFFKKSNWRIMNERKSKIYKLHIPCNI